MNEGLAKTEVLKSMETVPEDKISTNPSKEYLKIVLNEKEEEKASKISEVKAKILAMFAGKPKQAEEKIFTREEYIEKGKDRIRNWVDGDHMSDDYREGLRELIKTDPAKAELFVEALGKFPTAKWDDTKKEYVDGTKYVEPQNSLQ